MGLVLYLSPSVLWPPQSCVPLFLSYLNHLLFCSIVIMYLRNAVLFLKSTIKLNLWCCFSDLYSFSFGLAGPRDRGKAFSCHRCLQRQSQGGHEPLWTWLQHQLWENARQHQRCAQKVSSSCPFSELAVCLMRNGWRLLQLHSRPCDIYSVDGANFGWPSLPLLLIWSHAVIQEQEKPFVSLSIKGTVSPKYLLPW